MVSNASRLCPIFTCAMQAGYTALMLAAGKAEFSVMELLLKHNANVYGRNNVIPGEGLEITSTFMSNS